MSEKQKPLTVGILTPQDRIQALIRFSNSVEVDPHVPPKRYYRSGLEMVRMANVYLEEGSLESAYILYLKFMTLFLEKIRHHPNFNAVSVEEKAINQAKLREILPKAEKLKAQLLDRYTQEYNTLIEEKRRQLQAEEKQKQAKKAAERRHDSVIQDKGNLQTTVDVSIPNKIDHVQYPDPDSAKPKPSVDLSAEVSVSTIPEVPSVDRSSKPSSECAADSFARTGLRTVVVPTKVMSHFLTLSQANTLNNIETCGILAGKLEKNELIVTHMILPKQRGTSDSCTTMNEEEIFDYQDKYNLITVGWIHTHPTQTAFLSSVDLHTHCPYQLLMPEAIAIVCAPRYNQTGFFILTPNYGLNYIANCRKSGFHPHPVDPPLFMNAEHIKIDNSVPLEVLDLRVL